ncbi:50S ribosomal protein L15 [Nitrosomonas supralitoralis]|uniref:Large ribosomal subunit protein uL15 n=1 Tax=Nitrosomonas supralitoralis TaxID=2116706 RepID=A0A2P7NX23_9PROT|nr:50S ribosomal protein L15 [Nitrosomonas supralitoralis]PSJ18027.1 50S ribosomal protein L15 [Nitrosomonas supralitoralis]
MFLNTIKPAIGSVKSNLRVGRGMGSGFGKTCGRGHKGQKSRSGGYHKVGFEGGQMPIQRRLPKRGFTVLSKPQHQSIQMSVIKSLNEDVITIELLKKLNVITEKVKKVKIYGAESIDRVMSFEGISVSNGTKLSIEALGGKIL